MAFDKTKPTAPTSLRESNPEILENWSSLEAAVDNEHDFTTGGTQTGDHAQGSARCFSQSTAPTTRVDGGSFKSTDLGSLWVDTDDNAIYVLTAITPTWTPISDEVIATLLASNRVFGANLGVTGSFDPTSFVTTSGGFKDEDTMSSDSATAVASQQSIKAYQDNVVGNEADGQSTPRTTGYQIYDVDVTPTKVYTKYLTGNIAGATTNVAHGITTADDKILSMTVWVSSNSDNFHGIDYRNGSATNKVLVNYNNTHVIIATAGSFNNTGSRYRIKIEYTA